MPKSEQQSEKNKPDSADNSKQKDKENQSIPKAYKLLGGGVSVLTREWRTIALVLAVYFILTVVFSSGLGSSSTISQLKTNLTNSSNGGSSTVKTGLSVFSSLVGATLVSSPSNSDGQVLLFLIFSLIIIWLLRQYFVGKHPKARDAFYKSLYPLIPFFLIFLLLFLELVPASIGAYIYSLVNNSGLDANLFEKILWAIGCIGLAFLSLYLVVSSIFALYIVTLPDMTPIKALRSSWGLVKKRRWTFYRKVLFLPIVMVLITGILTVLFIIIAPVVAGWVFLLLAIASVAVSHSYMYTLYRESL